MLVQHLFGKSEYALGQFVESVTGLARAALIAEQGAEAVIPCNRTRKKLIPYDALAYRQRNLIERMFGRLKDFRRIATHYDKLVRNFFSAVLIAAIVIWWIN